MSLEYTHQPDYFLFAQLLMGHIRQYIQKHPDADNAIFDLRDIYQIFRQDLASTTTNLEGILNIADEYKVETLQGDQKLIQRYKMDLENNALMIDFHPEALLALREGKPLLHPDSTIQE